MSRACQKTFSILVHISLLAACVSAYGFNVQPPKRLTIIPRVMANFSYNSRYWPDGKMSAYLEHAGDHTSDFIIHFVNDYHSRSPDQFVDNITAPAGIDDHYQNPDRVDWGTTVNMAELKPRNGTVLPANQTGLLDDGQPLWNTSSQVTFKNRGWLFNIFRLGETSIPGTPSNKMIGFAHVEWTWGGCIFKWIGVRYSEDNGLSWTTPVPIITSGTMRDACAPYVNNTSGGPKNVGTGDFAAAWDPILKRWVILATENWLVMSVSSDPLGSSGTWQRIKPGSPGSTPSLIGNGTNLAHPDFTSVAGSNPSIIRDGKNAVWRIVYGKWGGGLWASTSTDLIRWTTPTKLDLNENVTPHPGSGYPSLIGDGGDQFASDGTATLYFTDNNRFGDGFKSLWAASVVFT